MPAKLSPYFLLPRLTEKNLIDSLQAAFGTAQIRIIASLQGRMQDLLLKNAYGSELETCDRRRPEHRWEVRGHDRQRNLV